MRHKLKIVTGDKNLDASEMENLARQNREWKNEIEYLRNYTDHRSSFWDLVEDHEPEILGVVFFLLSAGIVVLLAYVMIHVSAERTLTIDDYVIGVLGGAISIGILGMFLWLPFHND